MRASLLKQAKKAVWPTLVFFLLAFQGTYIQLLNYLQGKDIKNDGSGKLRQVIRYCRKFLIALKIYHNNL
jgi:hypothetical protein